MGGTFLSIFYSPSALQIKENFHHQKVAIAVENSDKTSATKIDLSLQNFLHKRCKSNVKELPHQYDPSGPF